MAQAFRLRARTYEQLGNPQLAIRDYDRYVALRPSDPSVYILRGDLLNLNLEHHAAIEDYGRALQIKPSAVGALVGRGLALVALGRYSEAIEDYRRALQLDPSNADVPGNLGIAYLLSGQYAQAAQYLELALQREKDPVWAGRMKSWLEHLQTNGNTSHPSSVPKALPQGPVKPLW